MGNVSVLPDGHPPHVQQEWFKLQDEVTATCRSMQCAAIVDSLVSQRNGFFYLQVHTPSLFTF